MQAKGAGGSDSSGVTNDGSDPRLGRGARCSCEQGHSGSGVAQSGRAQWKCKAQLRRRQGQWCRQGLRAAKLMARQRLGEENERCEKQKPSPLLL